MDRLLMGGVFWTAGAKWVSQIFSWAVMLVLARVLMPADFGLVGMATVYLGLVTLVSEFGFGTAVVTLHDLSGDQLRQINTMAFGLGLAGALVSCAAAVPLGLFFRSPKLPAVILALSSTFLMSSAQTVPYALLNRDLKFRLLAGINTAGAAGQSAVSLVLAFFGWGYWALVVGNIVRAAILSALPAIKAPCGFAWPRMEAVAQPLRFGWHVIVSRAAWYGYANSDIVIAGRALGAASLGAYSIAFTLATMPVEKVTNLLTSVTPPVFAAVQTQPAELRRYLLRMTEALALATFPATLGLALVASDFVRLALGTKWLGAIVPLEILAIYAAFRSIFTLLPQILIAVHETRFVMWISVAMLVVMPPVFYFGSYWGAAGIAVGWVIANPLLTLALYHRTFRAIGMSVREYVGGLWPALSASLVMCVAVVAAKLVMPLGTALPLRLGVEVAVGAAAYLGILWRAHRERATALIRAVKSLRAQTPAARAAS